MFYMFFMSQFYLKFLRIETVIFKNDESRIKLNNFIEADKKAIKQHHIAFNSFSI